MSKLKSNSLIIEKINSKHINQGWLQWVNDNSINKNLNSKQGGYTKKQLLAYIKKVKKRKEIMFAVRIKNNNEYLGNIKLNNIDYINKNCGYGLMMGNKKYAGYNYGILMLYKISEYAFNKLKMKKIFSPVFADNYSSIITHLKFGMKISGFFQNHFKKNKEFKDVFYFELKKDDFKKIKKKYN